MNSRMFRFLIVAGLAILSPLAGVAMAQSEDDAIVPADPAEVASRAAAAITTMADRCVEANAAVAERTTAAIEKILAEGNPRQAFRVAAVGLRVVQRRSYSVSRHIRARFAKAAMVLRRLDAEDLIPRLRLLTDAKLEAVAASRDEAIAAIRAALPAPDGEAVE